MDAAALQPVAHVEEGTTDADSSACAAVPRREADRLSHEDAVTVSGVGLGCIGAQLQGSQDIPHQRQVLEQPCQQPGGQEQHKLSEGTLQQLVLGAEPQQAHVSHAERKGGSCPASRSSSPAGISRCRQAHVLNKLRQQAARCIEKHELRMLQELRVLVQHTAASTAASAAAGAALGAGAAVAAAEHALSGRVELARGRLLSPPNSARTAAGHLADLERERLQSQLQAAEAKLHVHRIAAAMAKEKIQHLQQLVQQLQLKHSQQEQQLVEQQEHIDAQRSQLHQRDQQLLQLDQSMAEQELMVQRLQQQLDIKQQQVLNNEQLLQEAKAKLQGNELEQWKNLAAYASLDEQELRQQQQLLQQERAEHAVVEQQLRQQQQQLLKRHEHLELQQQQLQQRLQAQQAQSLQLQQQQEQVHKQQQQLEHQQQELHLVKQQTEQQRQHLLEQQQDLNQLLLQQQRQLASSIQPVGALPLSQPGPAGVLCGLEQVSTAQAQQGELLQQVAQTLSSPSGCAGAGAGAAAAAGGEPHSSSGAGSSSAEDHEFACAAAVAAAAAAAPDDVAASDAASTHDSWSSAVSTCNAGQCDTGFVKDPDDGMADPAQQQGKQDVGDQQPQPLQQPPHVPLLPGLGNAPADACSWQLIPSPRTLPAAEQHQYNASAFSHVLQHLSSVKSHLGTDPGWEQQRGQQQQRLLSQQDLGRLAECLQALVADNTVLSCEVFHLQQLLVQQRQAAATNCQALGKKLAADAAKLLWELQHDEVQQVLTEATRNTFQYLTDSSGGAGGSSTDGSSGSGSSGAAENRAVTALGVPVGGAAAVDAVVDAVKGKLEPLLAAHDAKIQALLTQLEDQATTCFASLDDTSNIQDIEEQLSEFEEVNELVQSSNGAAAEQGDVGPSATAAAPAGTADVSGALDSPPAGSARQPRAGRAFAISPSGYVSMLPSRRTSVAQPAAGVSTAAEGQAAAALIKRKSRLASLFEQSPVDPAAVAAGKEDKGRVSRLVRLFGSKGSSVRSSVELADQQFAEQNDAPCREDHSSPKANPDNQQQQEQGQQQQEQEQIQQQQGGHPEQQQEQPPNHVRIGGRRLTLAVLAEVAERLQEGDSCQHTSLHDVGSSASPPAPEDLQQQLQQQEGDTSSGSASAQDSCSVAFTGLAQLNEQQEECGHVTVLQPLDAEHQASPQAQLLLSVLQEAAMAVVAARHQAAQRD